MGDRTWSAMRPSGDFALLGAPPAFEQPLHVGRPNIGDRDSLHAHGWTRILDEASADQRRARSSMEFEAAVAAVGRRAPLRRHVQRHHRRCSCSCARSGCAARSSSPPFTFVALGARAAVAGRHAASSATSIRRTHNLDPAQRRGGHHGPTTRGILGVHLWGRPCAVDELTAIARRARAAARCSTPRTAFGCSHGGRMVGSFGAAEVFSFHATKVVNSLRGRRDRHRRRRAGGRAAGCCATSASPTTTRSSRSGSTRR